MEAWHIKTRRVLRVHESKSKRYITGALKNKR
jgi:hypothetical protein